MIPDERTARERLLDELSLERYAPVLSPPKRRQRRARQTAVPEPGPRPTGTGWPA